MRDWSKGALVGACAGLAAGFALPASAYESGYGGFAVNTGSFLNSPATTPPPGLYGSLIYNQVSLTIRGPGAPYVNGFAGNPTDLYVAAPVEILAYVPGFTLLGGVYSFSFAQQENVNATNAPANLAREGFHNTVFTPLILGYKLSEGLYAKINLAVVVPDGTKDGLNGLGNAGVPFTTIFPRLTTTYQKNGITFNNNIGAEFNTENPITGYTTGVILRDEATLTATFGRLTIGPAIAYIGQVTDDKSSFYYKYAINTNRYNQLAAGGIIGYDFGPVSLAVYGINEVFANASGGTPRVLGGPDTATTTGGLSVFFQASFKFPGVGGIGQPLDFGALRTAAAR